MTCSKPLVLQGSFIAGQPRISAAHSTAAAQPARAYVAPHVQRAVQAARTAAQPALQPAGASGGIRLDPVQLGLGRGLGKPLPPVVQRQMEAHFGAGFADVRVHVGREAESIGARAFTVGSSIYFAPGQYDPDSARGQQLLGHELAHVLQQRQGRVRNPFGSGLAVVHDRGLEAEAERMGLSVARARPAAAGTIQRVKKIDTSDISESDWEEARAAVRRVRTLRSPEVDRWLRRIDRWRRDLSLFDPRQRLLERYHHVFARQQLAREERRPHLVTRILRPDQLERHNIGINSIRISKRSLRRNLGTDLTPSGKGGKTRMTRLYAFMRKFGRAGGLQGFHRDPMSRIRFMRGLLEKMLEDPSRTTRSRRGPKFTIVALDPRALDSSRVIDTTQPGVREEFMREGKVGKFHKMYDQHAQEGVLAVTGELQSEELAGLRAFRGIPSEEELEEIMEYLLDLASGIDEPTSLKKPPPGPDQGSGGGGIGGGILV